MSARPDRDGPAPLAHVALFVTCMVDTMYPDVGIASVELLERYGVEVLFPEAQTCCGQPAYNSGHRREATQMAARMVEVFARLLEREAIDAVVTPSGSCAAMVKHFPRLFTPGTDAHERATRLAQATFELTQYLVDVLGVERVVARDTRTLTYHPCCHLLRELQVDAQPRRLLASLEGATLVELPGATECCGFGGLFSIENAAISTEMGRRKARNLADCGADVVAVSDVSCLTHLNGLLSREGHVCRAVHIAEIIAGRGPTAPERPGNDAG